MDSPGTSAPGLPSLADMERVCDQIAPGWRDAEAVYAEPDREDAPAPAPAPAPSPATPRRAKNRNWTEVNRGRRCEVCQGDHWCTRSADDRVHLCHKATPGTLHPRFGPGVHKSNKAGEPITLYFRDRLERRTWAGRPRPVPVPVPAATPAETAADHATEPAADEVDDRRDVSREFARFARNLTPDRARELVVEQFGLPAFAAAYAVRRGVGYRADRIGQFDYYGLDGVFNDREGWLAPEWDGSGARLVGGSVRLRSPRPGTKSKRFVTGWSRGVTFDPDFLTWDGPILVTEGFSDEFALSLAGIPVVGRPSNVGGVPDLIELARRAPGRDLVLIAERDPKPTGEYPGLYGSRRVAAALQAALPETCVWLALMPEPDPGGRSCRTARKAARTHASSKDPRSWLNARTRDDMTKSEYRALVREFRDLVFQRALRVGRMYGPHDLDLPGGSDRCEAAGVGATVRKKTDDTMNLALRNRCRRYSCAGCRTWLLATAIHAIREHIQVSGDDRVEQWPVNLADREGLPNCPKNRMYVAINPDGKWKSDRNRFSEMPASWLRVELSEAGMTATRDAMTAIRIRASRLLTGRSLKKTRSPDSYGSHSIAAPVTGPGVVVVVAIPPERPAPPGYVEVGVGDAIRVANVAILSVPPYPTAPSGPYRPIVTSHDWPLTTERETAGNFRRTGALAFPTEVAERLYSALGLRTRTFEDDNLAEAAAVGIGSPALAYVGARLLEGPRNQKRPAVDDLLWLAGEWARVVPPGQVDGPQFTAYVARHLFTGPPPGTRRLMERIAAFDAEWVAQEAAVRSEAAGIPDDLVKHLF